MKLYLLIQSTHRLPSPLDMCDCDSRIASSRPIFTVRDGGASESAAKLP